MGNFLHITMTYYSRFEYKNFNLFIIRDRNKVDDPFSLLNPGNVVNVFSALDLRYF